MSGELVSSRVDKLNFNPLSKLLEQATNELFNEFDSNGPFEKFLQASEDWGDKLSSYWREKHQLILRMEQEGLVNVSKQDKRRRKLVKGDQEYIIFEQEHRGVSLGPSDNIDYSGTSLSISIRINSPLEKERFNSGATIRNGNFSIYSFEMGVWVKNDISSVHPESFYKAKIDEGRITWVQRSLLKLTADGEKWFDQRHVGSRLGTVLEHEWKDVIDKQDRDQF